jgi:hypothetical protein
MLDALTVNVTVAFPPSARNAFAGETVQLRLSGNSQNTVMLVAQWLEKLGDRRNWGTDGTDPNSDYVIVAAMLDALTVKVTVAFPPSASAAFAGETVQLRLSGNSQNTVMLVA